MAARHRREWRRQRGCVRKQPFPSEMVARNMATLLDWRYHPDVPVEPYHCEFCGQWHLGRPNLKYRKEPLTMTELVPVAQEASEQEGSRALPLPDDGGRGFDLEALETASKGIRARLVLAVTDSANAMRFARKQLLGDEPLGVTDVAPLVRRLAYAADVFDSIASQFADAAAHCRNEIAVEALDAGVDRMIVPDGTEEIVVQPEVKTGWQWDDDSLAAAIAHVMVGEWGGVVAEDTADVERRAYRQGVIAGISNLNLYAKISWRSTALDGLKRLLMAKSEDAIAGLVEKAGTRTREHTGRLKVIREERKQRRRL